MLKGCTLWKREGGPFQMGINDNDDHGTQYNLVENNEMAYGGHHVAWLGGTYNIYRNNYFHNEPWCPTTSPKFATRIIVQNGYAAGGDDIDGIHNLNEGNRIGYGGPKNKREVGGNVVQVMGAWNIWQHNIWAQSYLSAIWLYCYNDYGEVTKYNHIYNNNFWMGGYGYYQDYYDPGATGLGKNAIEQVILTHSHSDHAAILPLIREKYHPVVYAYSAFAGADIVLKDGQILHCGDRHFEVIHIPGHSDDSICLYCSTVILQRLSFVNVSRLLHAANICRQIRGAHG
jgi:hypothetical protein